MQAFQSDNLFIFHHYKSDPKTMQFANDVFVGSTKWSIMLLSVWFRFPYLLVSVFYY